MSPAAGYKPWSGCSSAQPMDRMATDDNDGHFLLHSRQGVGLEAEFGIPEPREKLRVCFWRPLRSANKKDSWEAWRRSDLRKKGKCFVVGWRERISDEDDLARASKGLTCFSPEQAGM